MTIQSLQPWLAHRARRRGVHVNTIVLHASAGSSLSGAVSTLRDRGLSYHYLIDKDGAILKCCPVDSEAFHAGISFGPQGPSVNRYSIGVCFINRNDGRDPYTPEQYAAAKWLLPQLKPAMYSYSFLTTHYGVSWPRKSDPRGFDVVGLARDVGLRAWKKEGVEWLG